MIALGSVIALVITVWLLIQLPGVQNWLIDKVTSRLSKDLQTKIEIDRVDFSLFNKMKLKGVLVEDRQKDTILSAGEISVNITDWFFLKNNIELKYIGLRDVYAHLQRSDSVWRHQFLIDFFSTPGSTQKKQGGINLALKEVDLKNIRIKQQDGWRGEDMTISLASLHSHPRQVDFKQKIMALDLLDINQPYFAIYDYEGNRPKDYETKVEAVSSDTSSQRDSTQGWKILVFSLKLGNGKFKLDQASRPLIPDGFDPKHIEFAHIYGDFKNVKWENDSITASAKLSTKERSGFEVKHLLADARFTPTEMTFENLDIETNDSHLGNFFSMRYDAFDDMSDFVEKVRLEGRFHQSIINSDDIAFFAPDLKSWKKKIELNGEVNGPVAAMVGKNLDLKAGDHTFFTGDASLTGLPEINNTYIDVKATELKTIYSDAVAFVPPLKDIESIHLSKLGQIVFKGNFAGFINDFVTYGTIQTALGTVKADLNMKLQNPKFPVYSGMISTPSFNLGALINDSTLGYVSLDGNLKGTGFETSNGNIGVDAKINFIDYNKYRFQNITVDGELNKKIFDGSVFVNDPNAHLNLNGLIDLSKKSPEFNFIAHIDSVDFRKINLLNTPIAFRGNINAQFSGNNIDDFLGNANITNAQLTHDGHPLSFNSLVIQSTQEDSLKHLSIVSNEFNADLFGQFKITDLPNAVTQFLNRYYPSYIKKPKQFVYKQAFSFDVQTGDFDNFAQMIDSSISGLDNSHITGSINTNTNNLKLEVSVPVFKYQQFRFTNIDIFGEGNYDSLLLRGSVDNIGITDSIQANLTSFNLKAFQDVSEINIFAGSNGALDQAQLKALVNTYSDGVGIRFSPSTILVNGKLWTIEDKGGFEYRKNIPSNGLLVFRETNQEIKIETKQAPNGTWNDIVVGLKNFNLGDISSYLMPQNRLEGLVNATVVLDNPGKDMRIRSDDFVGSGIRLDNDSLGNINAQVLFDLPTQELTVQGGTMGDQEKSLAYNVKLFFKDKQSQENNLIALKANHFDLKYLDRFMNTLFSDLSGDITGNFDIKGPFDALNVAGKGRLHNAGLKVNFTQCYYKILDKDITLTDNEINLNGIVLKDTVTDNPVYLSGSILHNSFDNMFFDITVSTRKPGTRDSRNNLPVQVLNTTISDNKVFYGNVRATGSFVLVGPQDNAFMKIDAIASDQDESFFTIASSNSRAGKMPDWMVERKYGEEMETKYPLANTDGNITYELDVTANPKVLMKFVMDDLTGDQIEGRGSGSLNIRAGTTEDLAIKGRLDIEEGSYNYTFKSFFPKPFEIIKGTENFISWSGDPMNAKINLQARYKAERVSFSPLAGINIDQSYANTRENVYVYANLTGELFKPDFKFELELEPNSRYSNDYNVTNMLQQIERSQSEVTRQVTYLIVFNSFAPPQTGVSNIGMGAAAMELTYSTISSLSSLFFNEINKKLNNVLSELLGTDVSVVFSGSVYNRNVLGTSTNDFAINQANVTGALMLPLFKDRLIISLGSTLEMQLQSSLQKKVQFLPDVTAEWLLNPSGSIRLNLFYRENLDFLTTSSSGAAKNLKRTGGGISFRKEFDNFSDVFINQRKKAAREMARDTISIPDSLRR